MKTRHASPELKKVHVLLNSKSGLGTSFDSLLRQIETAFRSVGAEISYQFSHDEEDGKAKTRQAIRDLADAVLVAGGDGMVNSIGSELIGTSTALGVIPTGSGNGFARHFEIPMDISRAAHALARGRLTEIDVGLANGKPFFVTCSMAWDAAIVRGFNALPFRGILPYVFAAASEWFTYVPQPISLTFDDGETLKIEEPLICTVANLTQYGGGAQIAPEARPDDGIMEMVLVRQQDLPVLLVNVGRLFNGTIHRLPQVITRRFKSLKVRRKKPAAIQLDGELIDSPADLHVQLHPERIRVLVPNAGKPASIP